MGIFASLKARPGLNRAAGIVLAIVAGLMLLGYASRVVKGAPAGKLVVVPTAGVDIAMGSTIKREMLDSASIPSAYVVPGALRKVADIAGSRAIRFIGKGEPITASSIAGGKGAGALASRIPPDLRAYSVAIADGTGGSSDLRPGDRVDVLSTGGEPPSTTTLLTGRLVLSAGVPAGAEGEASGAPAPGSLTLLVSPREAELLAQAESMGEISVSLCPLPDDEQEQGGK
ncbi:MAG TPA: Flp pilus assembly protein CpaB [Candidatus Anoxymicrobiaceae bacterium]